MTYVVGMRPRVSTEVRDIAGVLTDTTVSLTVTRPDGTTVQPAVGHPSTGVYTADVLLTQAGDWLLSWAGTGAVEVADFRQFHVVSPVLRIVGLDEVKEHGNITTTTADRELLDFIGTAQQMIEDVVGAVVPATWTERLATSGLSTVYLGHAPVLSVTSVQEVVGGVAGTALASSLYEVDAETGALRRLSGGYRSYWTGGYVDVTYRAGRLPIPEAIRWAAKELTVHLWRSTQTQRGGRGRGEVDVSPAGFGLPNRVREALAPFAPSGLGVA